MPALLAKLKDLAPYAVVALVVPGGSLIAPFLWLHRARTKVSRIDAAADRGGHL
jgi:hypothetical protein